MLVPDRLPPLLRSIRAALFPNNAPGASSLVAPSSEQELVELKRRCASAIWAAVPKSVGRLYYGSLSFWQSSNESSPNTPQHEDNASTSRSGSLNHKGSKSSLKSHNVSDVSPASCETTATQASGAERINQTPSSSTSDEEEDRILSEIETGILDLFSDAYCNKHLVYGMLELILVRLMPELADKGIIELWEERLH
ncbi:hypothetical protein BKA67DRAFT_264129 [Truncatella angustata]|uniref:Uncharacterized protein n=1 Tax=Truncatella angustata TaxID=152316 RepID=A0A9P8UKK0_9PEZI|nr:uncharacterized protein BKA67DRAFT_264129 [Truncatella angustata]KAH6653909.1 hypothetical protein BKA67DRAFT_264129 [Truncatella angustata]